MPCHILSRLLFQRANERELREDDFRESFLNTLLLHLVLPLRAPRGTLTLVRAKRNYDSILLMQFVSAVPSGREKRNPPSSRFVYFAETISTYTWRISSPKEQDQRNTPATIYTGRERERESHVRARIYFPKIRLKRRRSEKQRLEINRS